MPEVLIIQLVCFVPTIKACGSEDGQEAGVIDTLLTTTQREGRDSFPVHPATDNARRKSVLYVQRAGIAAHLLVDCPVTVPAGHRLQHAAEETSVAVRLIFCTAGHSVNDSREHLQTHTRYVK